MQNKKNHAEDKSERHSDTAGSSGAHPANKKSWGTGVGAQRNWSSRFAPVHRFGLPCAVNYWWRVQKLWFVI